MTANTTVERIVSTVGTWPGVKSASPSGGDTVLSVEGREFGRVGASGVIDVPATRALRNQMLTDGIADRHHAWPRSSWVTYRVRSPADAEGAVRLLRFAYLCRLLALENRAARRGDPGTGTGIDVDVDAAFERLGVSRGLADLAGRTYRRTVPA